MTQTRRPIQQFKHIPRDVSLLRRAYNRGTAGGVLARKLLCAWKTIEIIVTKQMSDSTVAPRKPRPECVPEYLLTQIPRQPRQRGLLRCCCLLLAHLHIAHWPAAHSNIDSVLGFIKQNNAKLGLQFTSHTHIVGWHTHHLFTRWIRTNHSARKPCITIGERRRRRRDGRRGILEITLTYS